MKLLAFRIYNYKSIIDSGECDLSGEGITILAGQNEAGKTSILEALRDFDYLHSIDADQVRPEGLDDAVPTIECTFSVDSEDVESVDGLTLGKEEFPYHPPPEIKSALIDNGKITIRKIGPSVYNIVDKPILAAISSLTSSEVRSEENASAEVTKSRDPQADLVEVMMRQSPYFIYFASFEGCLPRRKYLSDIEKKSDAGYQAVQDFLTLAGIDLGRLGDGQDPKKVSNYLESKSAGVTGEFLTYWSQKYDGKNSVALAAELMRDEKGQFLSFFVKDERLRKYPEQRSKGFLWFLSFYLRLNAESIDKEGLGAVILVDEPGACLHPRAQRDILKIMKEKLVLAGNQVVFSTHSSDLIDPDRLNRIRLVLNGRSQGTTVHKLTDSAVRANGDTEFSDALSPIVVAIGKDLGQGFSMAGRKNVLVEGISDYYYLTTLRNKPAFKIPADVKILPLTGAPSVSHMVSIMIGWGLDYVVVMDRDDQSDKALKKLTDDLDVPKEKILQIEGGKAIEDLFTDRDFKKFVARSEDASWMGTRPKSDVFKSQKVVLSRNFCEEYKDKALNVDEQTRVNFGKIFDFINKNFP
jgi:hypothetical protein